jgi:hypothetical protein
LKVIDQKGRGEEGRREGGGAGLYAVHYRPQLERREGEEFHD